MSDVRVDFSKCIQDSQDFGSDDEHMVSRVFFTLSADGKSAMFTADVKQPVGSAYADAPLEVSAPAGYKGPFNYESYRRCVESYYRTALARMVSVGPNAHVRMRHNVIYLDLACGFEADASAADGW